MNFRGLRLWKADRSGAAMSAFRKRYRHVDLWAVGGGWTASTSTS